MPGQTWPGAAASFFGMWVVMMVAMMMPCLVPMLWRYRKAVSRTSGTRLSLLTALVGVGYFFVWTLFGIAAFPLGVTLSAIEMQLPDAILSFHWRFEELHEDQTLISQRLVLSGPKAKSFVAQVSAMEVSVPEGMRRVVAAIERSALITAKKKCGEIDPQ